MGREELELAVRFAEPLLADDIEAALNDEAALARLRPIVDPEAEIAFIVPEGGGFGPMEGPFKGVEGLRAGWLEWLQPWERFRIELKQNIDLGDGGVLSLAEAHGRISGGAEISQQAAAITRVRHGMIVAVGFYLDQEQARRNAGLE